ncbi:methylenetetrahydrofolate reductase [Aminobacter anthyllidis]|uniref:Methylenetetrahydrofolate reductase n=1 Tax=Aminobacter anthyllidis TaxID=1035067 RepID=A0A9X1AGU8_9HYPH|nr:methylenetetrahydrofolate reductase [Aminobacter anthyllidis]MBT1159680.1 methylenetetrahydrofolate reductase [Aminobacter anthyllidis]
MHDAASIAFVNVREGAVLDSGPDLIRQASIELTPRTAAKVASFGGILPAGQRVYIANLGGDDDGIVETAKRLTLEGLAPMPHIVARTTADAQALDRLLGRLAGEAGVSQALVLGGNNDSPSGNFSESMELVRTGLFDKHGFQRLHFAGHPEGNPSIAPAALNATLLCKANFARSTDADVALVTQFLFDAKSLVEWLHGLECQGIDLPVHVGICGPSNPHTLLKFAISCGVGNSIKVLRNQLRNVWTLTRPYVPNEFVRDVVAALPTLQNFAGFHVFPFGGVEKTGRWMGQGGDPRAWG